MTSTQAFKEYGYCTPCLNSVWDKCLGPYKCARAGRKAIKRQEDNVTRQKHEFVTEEGIRLICGPRMEHYGPPHDNLNDIGDAITPYVKRALAVKGRLDGTDVCAVMIILKTIRSAKGFHRDSFADICGYAGLAEVLNDPEAFTAFIYRAAEGIEDPTARSKFVAKFLPNLGTERTAKEFGLPDSWIEDNLRSGA